MLKESKVAVISAILDRLECLFYLYSKPRSPLSQQSWRICVKGIQGRRYLSNLGGFVLKEYKVAVISAILDRLECLFYLYSKPRSPLSQQSWRICVKGIQGRRYLSNLGGFVLKESRSPLSQQSWRICVKGT